MAVISGIDAQKRKNYNVTSYSGSCGAGPETVSYSGFANLDAGRSPPLVYLVFPHLNELGYYVSYEPLAKFIKIAGCNSQ
jgi:hypothetical protein